MSWGPGIGDTKVGSTGKEERAQHRAKPQRGQRRQQPEQQQSSLEHHEILSLSPSVYTHTVPFNSPYLCYLLISSPHTYTTPQSAESFVSRGTTAAVALFSSTAVSVFGSISTTPTTTIQREDEIKRQVCVCCSAASGRTDSRHQPGQKRSFWQELA